MSWIAVAVATGGLERVVDEVCAQAVDLGLVRVCAACGAESPEGNRFCGSCGAALAAPAVERRKLTTSVFCDLTGSTQLAEKVDAEAMFELMRSYFETARAALEAHGGTVEKFIGDAVVGMFGVPETHEDDALRACRAALEIQERVGALNSELEQRLGTRIVVRVGVNSGEVVAADIGARDMFATGDSVVLGDAVNVAARLEQAAAPGEVLLGEQTYRLVRDAVRVEPLGPLELKGKSEPVSAYRLLEVAATGPAPRRTGTPLVGRDQELALLEHEFDSMVSGGGCRVVTVVGEPGVGKSRLVAELLGRIGPRARVVHGACLSYGEGITYWALGQIVRGLAGIDAEQSGAAAREQLSAFLADAPDGRAVEEQIAQLLGIADGSTTSEELAWATRRFLAVAAAERPLAVLVDDIHWAEPVLLELLAGLSGGLPESPILVVCLSRPELLDHDPAWPATLRLEPLPGDAIDTLLASLGAPPVVRERLARAAAGNPLFAEELVAMLIDGGVLRREGDGAVLAGELDQIELPATLNALLGARLDRLDGRSRGALERGAVEGELFHQAAIVALSEEGSRPAVPVDLGHLARKDLIRLAAAGFVAGGVAYRFKHILVREAAYLAMTKKLRASLHERFADWLERFAGDRIGEYEEILGYHLEQAHRYRTEIGLPDAETRALGERAAAHLAAAGKRATARGDYRAAANLIGRALVAGIADPRDRVQLQVELGSALCQSWQVDKAAAVLADAEATASSLGERGIAARAVVEQVQNRLGDGTLAPDERQSMCEGAIETLTGVGDEFGLARAHQLLYLVLAGKGRMDDAGAAIERAVAHAEATGDVELRRRVINTIANNYLCRSPVPVEQAIARCGQLLRSGRSDRVLEAVIKRALGLLHVMAMRFDEGLELIRDSSPVLDELKQEMMEVYRGNVVEAKELAGDPAGAEQEQLARWAYFRDLRPSATDMRAVGVATELARLCCNEERWEEAAVWLSYHRDIQHRDQRAGLVATRLMVEARLAAQNGRWAEALDAAGRAVRETDKQMGRITQRADMWAALADLQRAAGESAAAEASAATALDLYLQKGNLAAAERLRAAAPSSA